MKRHGALLSEYWSYVVQLPASVLASLYCVTILQPLQLHPTDDTAYPHIIFVPAVHEKISYSRTSQKVDTKTIENV